MPFATATDGTKFLKTIIPSRKAMRAEGLPLRTLAEIRANIRRSPRPSLRRCSALL